MLKPTQMPSDLQIARKAHLKPTEEVAEEIGVGPHLLEHYGKDVAKIKLDAIEELEDRPRAKYVVVSAITPTPLGEGKTSTTVGLGQGLQTSRQDGHRGRAPALYGTDLRHKGRRRRRRLQPGSTYGDAKPPPHR